MVNKFTSHWVALQDIAFELLRGKYSETVNKFYGNNPMIKSLERYLNVQAKSEYRVLIIGDTSSGKSTMINTILGLNLLPSDPSECTAIFTEIAYSPGFELLFFDEKNVLGFYQKFDSLDVLRQHLQAVVDIDYSPTALWYRIRVNLPLPILQVSEFKFCFFSSPCGFIFNVRGKL